VRKGPKINPHAIVILSRYFNAHKKGLPEWMKNAREAYLRKNIPASDRHVIINYSSKKGGELECIDFAGISGKDLDERYFDWANPNAAKTGLQAKDVEGGQGSGGKAYLREMFDKGYFISVCDKRISVVTFLDKEKLHLDFFPDEATGKDYDGEPRQLKGIREYAGDWLEAYGLPRDHNVTIVRGIGPQKSIDPDRLLEDIQQSPHARQTINACKVHFFVDGKIKRELTVKEPALHKTFPKKFKIPIPPVLHLADGTAVRTSRPPEYPEAVLELGISEKPLSGQALQSWNRIDFYATGVTVVGWRNCTLLPLKVPQFATHIFGTCTVPLLKDPRDNYEMQSRQDLKDGELSEALYAFIASEADKRLEQLAKQVEGVKKTEQQEKLQRLHQRLTDWIGERLAALRGWSEGGEEEGSGKQGRRPPKARKHKPAVVLKIHREKLDIAKDATYELRAVAYDANGIPVPAGKVVWRSAKPSVAAVDPDRGILRAVSPGLATISVENKELSGQNQTLVQVHDVEGLEIKGSSPLRVGSKRRLPLQVKAKTKSGKTAPADLVVMWQTGDQRIATVGQDGNLVGGEVGETDVLAFAGDIESERVDVVVDLGSAGRARGAGKGKPKILLSGVHPCPFSGEPVLFAPSDPPIHQRAYQPKDHEFNVFWINLQHPLADELRAHGWESLQWRSYHFQRVLDVYTIIDLRQTFGEQQNLDVETVLDQIQSVAAEIYKDLSESSILSILSEEQIDLESGSDEVDQKRAV
jgi:hypothetical protein